MAEETPVKETQKPEQSAESSFTRKLIIFGVPAFFVQLVVVYFLTAKFVVPLAVQNSVATPSGAISASGVTEEEHSSSPTDIKDDFIFVIKDMIINPAGTNGQRYLLTTIAFNVSTEEAMKSLEKREMAVRDLLNTILTSKTMDQLIDVSKREALRQEIFAQAKPLVENGALRSVYFSKYIIQ